MVERLELNAMLTRAVMRKDFANKLLSRHTNTRERALAKFQLDLTSEERKDFLAFEGKELGDLMAFCRQRFELDKPRVP